MNSLSKKIVGVILAAGEGKRIYPLSNFYPKPLLPICNKPIIQYQIEALRGIGIIDIYIVVGHLQEMLKKYLEDGSKFGVKIMYVKQNKQLGIAHAIGQLKKYLSSPFLLLLGDIFFETHNLEQIIEIFYKKKASIVIAVKNELDIDAIKKNFSVILDNNGEKVIHVEEKPKNVTTHIKGCGLYLFDQIIFDDIQRTKRTPLRNEYEITTTLQIAINSGRSVYKADVIDDDVNITHIKDLLKCNMSQLSKEGKKIIIDPTAYVHEKCVIENSIIGGNVQINKAINIYNSVIFDNVKITSDKDISNAIITPYLHI